jgi:hydrogenase 3 maturation protease
MMGDDAAGMLVVQKLKASLPVNSLLSVIEGGPAPENCTGAIRKLSPGMVILVDAGDFQASPGSVALFTAKEAVGVSAFGHSLPLHVIGGFIETELRCPVLLLLIQPESIEYDHGITPRVNNAVQQVSQMFLELQI